MQQRWRVRPWMLVSAAWIIPAVFGAIDQYAQSRLTDWATATPGDLLFASGDWFLYAFLTPFIFVVSRRWPLIRPHLARRALLHFVFALLFCVLWATIGKLFQLTLGLLLEPDAVGKFIAESGDNLLPKAGKELLSWIFTTFPFGIAVYLCVVGVEHAIRYFVEAREREVQIARLAEQLTSARYSALQAQLNPHFLFNTLNTIAVRARDGDSAGTVLMVEQLSDVLRRTLTREQVNEVTLEEELDLVRQYLAIEQARFSDRLRPEFTIEKSALDAAVPSFAIQHLVENAIRHGITRRTGAGRVSILARRQGDTLRISVTDDGIGIDVPESFPMGHGIENTRERLQALYGTRASLEVAKVPEGGTVAIMQLPYHAITGRTGNAES